MGTLAKLFSYPDKIIASFFLKILPEILRIIILSICIIWKHYKLVSSNYKYMYMINKKSTKFVHRKEAETEPVECRICLSEFATGDEGREIKDCKHVFHRNCLEKWLQGYRGTCPLCRSSVVPEVIVAEYHLMQIQQENDMIEKELTLIFLNALHGRICNGRF
ncbi:hypothetical protein ACJIZ3_003239 [Penstemon smallii]|uniref:RING-type domain-containing protein n=1 Tax=Penstemon smallii TaxID=265156 RepID=A0ABD3UAN4_9LAMI